MKIAALGDSLTYGYGVRRRASWPHLLAEKLEVSVGNYGVSGDTSGGMLARFSAAVLPEKPTHLILMGGSNDIIMGLDPVIPAANLRAIVFQAVQAQIKVTVGIPIVPMEKIGKQNFLREEEIPRVVRERLVLKEKLEAFAQTGLFRLVDFQAFIEGEEDVYLDGLHLNEKGNRLFAEGLTPLFRKR